MTALLAEPLASWYSARARNLPWRDPVAPPWAVLVSEVMLQQTPVARVIPAFRAWLERWPDPPALSAATPADAVRQWGRLGYPRRAIRLHATAGLLVGRHAGLVPASVGELRALPGVGAYTAAAVASFAFGQRHAVLDVNARRVLSRLVCGTEPATSGVSAAEMALAESLLPADGWAAARWSVAVMELGALVCRPANPGCHSCPVAAHCAWLSHGCPPAARPRQRQAYQGSDRQCRGALLAALREASGPVQAGLLAGQWPDQRQRTRVVQALIADGLAVRHPDGTVGLPGEHPGGTAGRAGATGDEAAGRPGEPPHEAAGPAGRAAG